MYKRQGYKCTLSPVCDNDGKCEAGETIYNCPNDCISPPNCDPIWAIGDVTIIPNLSPRCISWGSPFIWVMTILGGIIVFYFTYNYTAKKTPKNKALNVIISIILGIGSAILIYFYWWVFLIIIVIMILIKIFIR